MKVLTYTNWKIYYRLLSVFILMLILTCKANVNNKVSSKNIIITIAGDEGITVATENTIQKNINTKWKDIQSDANKKITSKDGYNFLEWRLGNKAGEVLTDEKMFTSDVKIIAISKKKDLITASYRIEHWQQNIENDEYNKKEEENKTGEVGKDTEAIAKTYTGFKAKAFNQAKVKADGSTIIKIEYDRNITSIILDLDGGETTTQLEKGEGNQKVLRGKFEAKIEIEKPTKRGFKFVKWEPALPEKFLAEDDGAVYKAEWKVAESFVYINGDERLDIAEETKLDVDFATPKTWAEIKAQVKAKVPLKADWNGGDYAIYEWRENDENGKLIDDNTPITKGMKLFAITNYIKFKMQGTKLLGYSGGKPKGKIIIDKTITEVGKKAFSGCSRITSVDFSRCVNLLKIEEKCFYNCGALKNVNLSGCINLTSISGFAYCISLKSIDLSPCKNLRTIANGAFGATSVAEGLENINLSGLTNVTTIEEYAFASSEELKTIDLSDLINLETIGDKAFVRCYKLKMIDLSNSKKLTRIGEYAFDENDKDNVVNLIVKLPTSIESLGEYCFGYYNSTNIDRKCKQVIVPNEDVKLLVIATNYPEERITIAE